MLAVVELVSVCLDLFEHRAIGFRDFPVPCPFDDQSLVFRVGQRDGVFLLSHVNQDFYGALAVVLGAHEQLFASIAVFESVEDNQIGVTYLVHNSPDFTP